MEDRKVRTVSGMEASARRIEDVVEEVRAEIGRVETKWAGLSNRAEAGESEADDFAREVLSAHESYASEPLMHLFVLRQIEIALALISRLSGEVSRLNESLAALQDQLEALRRQG